MLEAVFPSCPRDGIWGFIPNGESLALYLVCSKCCGRQATVMVNIHEHTAGCEADKRAREARGAEQP